MGNSGSKTGSGKPSKKKQAAKGVRDEARTRGKIGQVAEALPEVSRTDTQRSTGARSVRSVRSRQSQSSLRNSVSNGSILLPSKPGTGTGAGAGAAVAVGAPTASRRSSQGQTQTLTPGVSRRSSSSNVVGEPMMPILKKPGRPSGGPMSSMMYGSDHAVTDDDEDDEEDEDDYDDDSIPSKKVKHRSKQQLKRHRSLEEGVNVRNLLLPRSQRKSESNGVNPHINELLLHNGAAARPDAPTRRGSSGGNTVYGTPLHTPTTTLDGGEADYFTSRVSRRSSHGSLGRDKAVYPSRASYIDDFADGAVPNTPGGDDAELLAGSPSVGDGAVPIGTAGIGSDGANVKKKKVVDVDDAIERLISAGYAAKRTKNVCLKNFEIAQICRLAREIFLAQPTLLELSPSVKIVGDVHGQYCDLLRLFSKCGFPPSANYLFLGDYVDRGKQSLETILLLLCYKIKYPENFFLLRGNHECANVTRVYGFYDECKRRCNIKTWKHFVDTFNTLPLAAIVTGKIFCVHGGLSPGLNSMDEIRHVGRPTDVPDFGLVNDLLWSDPADSPNEWEDNERGVSYCYNKVAINKFLNKFGFDLVCRAHMVVEDGYEFFNDRSLVTVFSAPNYCGEFDNWGAVMTVSEGLLCSFELLDPLDKAALKQVMKKGRQERRLLQDHQEPGPT
ncbi:salt homeostasis regulator KNAG_0C03110 [Huiozyma naganishii CBS 8797]|uniref:Serine/threonine-protein phosphatase n=1 Tax=Huiozyma naganishii (strain ATCC MYA-139 / BCRC 22969 / CBS 8797 / KCTC 17520 / NBRC 10181 / NCYC 3082 / Yp74L-3) TaxID=1071383 RepID=J7RWN0_HUIN7|nr:hypothetical protein KNAG_0C03110 [Kazachstania naganishii CBS 8797]CCK69422.1 hypothetical protein KNAG_0C03110 [Kazachstania naganishii CBS 8797]